jgi:membrane fusion protein (multidrug efflux system)
MNREETPSSPDLAPQPAAGPPMPTRSRGLGRRLAWLLFRGVMMIAGPAAILVAGGYYYVVTGRYVSTDNAYVKADKVVISTDVSERVIEVAVRENDAVAEGQILFRLDPEPFRISFSRAEAQLKNALQEIEVLQATRRQKQAELKIAESDVDYHQRTFARQDELGQRGIISQAKLDEARRDMRAALQRVLAIRQEIERVTASLGGEPELPKEKHPSVLAAKSAVDQAALELRRTTVKAPAAGVVTNVTLQAGEHVRAGTPVFSLVRAGRVWIDANLKETDLTHVRPGQQAEVRIDTYPERTWRATVVSISPATGSEFALLPPQNASGNWVKVVQRLPVRLSLVAAPSDPPLRAGMSAHVSIDTQKERELPSFVAEALAWFKGGS